MAGGRLGVGFAQQQKHIRLAPATDSPSQWQQANSEPAARPAKRKRLACIPCRQSKLRCENSAGAECTRCRKFSLDCTYDAEFRRVNKRAKLKELEDEVHQLRTAVQTRTPTTKSSRVHDSSPGKTSQESSGSQRHASLPPAYTVPTPASPAVPPRSTSGFSNGNAQAHETAQPPSSGSPIFTASRASAKQPRSLHHVSLTTKQIDWLFNVFFTYHHEFFPTLDPQTSPDDYHSSSPLLFWTIISIASRRDEENAFLLTTLSLVVLPLVWKTIGTLPHSRADVKAIALLCTWPFPNSSMHTDPTFILCSVAKSAAMQLGLHRPEIIQDFLRSKSRFSPDELLDAVKVWIGCFIAAESITGFIGQPSLFTADSTIDRVCEANHSQHLHPNLLHLLLCFRFCNRAHRIMASKERRGSRLFDSEDSVLLVVIEREYEDLQRELGDKTSVQDVLLLLYAGLQFRTYYFFDIQPNTRREGLLKGYNKALMAIKKIQEAQATNDFLGHAPVLYTQALVLSCMFIFKILSSTYRTFVDIEEGTRAFNCSLSLLRRASTEDNDMIGRVKKIMAQLWSLSNTANSQRNGNEDLPGLQVKTRLGGSMLHDTLWTWRKKFGGQDNRDVTPTQRIPSDKHPSSLESQNMINETRPPDPSNTASVHAAPSLSGESNPQPPKPSLDLYNGLATVTNPQADFFSPQDYFSQSQCLEAYPETSFDNLNCDFLSMPDNLNDWSWEYGLSGLMPIDFDPQFIDSIVTTGQTEGR